MVTMTGNSTEIIVSGETLPQCAKGIADAQLKIERSASEMLDHACEAGRLLNVAKSKLSHGKFGPWIAENCSFTDRTARLYLRIFNNWASLLDYRETNPSLTFVEAVKYLSEPKPTDDDDSKRKSISDLDEELAVTPARTLAENEAIIEKHLANLREFEHLLDNGDLTLPGPGEVIYGTLPFNGSIAIESYPFDPAFVRIMAIMGGDDEGGGEIRFTRRGITTSLARWAIENLGVSSASIEWGEPQESQGSNNPHASLLPEWRYPVEAA